MVPRSPPPPSTTPQNNHRLLHRTTPPPPFAALRQHVVVALAATAAAAAPGQRRRRRQRIHHRHLQPSRQTGRQRVVVVVGSGGGSRIAAAAGTTTAAALFASVSNGGANNPNDGGGGGAAADREDNDNRRNNNLDDDDGTSDDTAAAEVASNQCCGEGETTGRTEEEDGGGEGRRRAADLGSGRGGSGGRAADASAAAAASPLSSKTSRYGPALLLAGAAFVYGAVLRHPNCILTGPAAACMVLYAVQTGLQPRLSKRYLPRRSDKKIVAFVEELVKTALAVVLYLTMKAANGGDAASSTTTPAAEPWSLASSLHVAAVPAALYAVQGVLTYTSYPYLDAVTFNGFGQTKTVSAALCCWLLLGQTQTPRQMISILLLVASAIVFVNKNQVVSSDASGDISSKGGAPPPVSGLEWWSKGVLPCLGATMVSGLAGAFSQRGLQIVHRDPYLFTIEVSVYSAICLALSMLVSASTRSLPSPAEAYDGDESTGNSKTHAANRFERWGLSRTVLIPVTVKAVGGILTALVHKYAGSVLKGFALVLGLVLSGLLQAAIDRRELSVPQVMGTLLVLLSSWMHFTPQTEAPAAP